MKWFRFISFVLIFFIGFSVLNSLQPDEASDRWKYFYSLPPNSIDIVFMGNSHNFVAFNPHVIDKILNTNSYVVGFDAENIVASYYELKDVLKFQQPQAVVLETFALDLRRERMIDQGFIYEFLDAGRMTENKIKLIATLLFPDHLPGIFPLFRIRMEWEKPCFYLNNLKTQIQGLDNKGDIANSGELIIPIVIPSEEYEESLSLPDLDSLEPYPENLDYFNKFLIACYQNHVIPLFVTTPIIHIDPRTYSETYAPLNKDLISKEYNLEILNFNQYKFNQLHFYNATHLNAFGSLIASTEMAVDLSERLSIPVNQKRLDYYHTYYFEKFTITQKGNESTITLYPNKPDAPLLYAWKITRDDTIIINTDYQSHNSITFPASNAGEYQIQVEIWNPEGDFVLNGQFTHLVEE